jgi:hypothetical protein
MREARRQWRAGHYGPLRAEGGKAVRAMNGGGHNRECPAVRKSDQWLSSGNAILAGRHRALAQAPAPHRGMQSPSSVAGRSLQSSKRSCGPPGWAAGVVLWTERS